MTVKQQKLIEWALPETIKVGSLTLKIIPVSAEENLDWNLCGQFCSKARQIRLWTELKGENLASTFMHEVMHALFYDRGSRHVFTSHRASQRACDELEEYLCETVANGFTQIMRDNPWLPFWLELHVPELSIEE